MNQILNKKFKHHKWFLEGVTVAYALDYFAKCGDFYIGKKPARKQSDNLLDDIIYDDVLMCDEDRSSYRLSSIEKEYFLERQEFWNRERERKHNEWLKASIDFEEKVEQDLRKSGSFDTEYAKRQLISWKKCEYKDQDQESIKFWQNKIKDCIANNEILDLLFEEYKDRVKTNEDYIEFKTVLYEKIEDYKTRKEQ